MDLFPDTTVDRTAAKNWFMGHGVGLNTADKMVALFVLLKSGEITGETSPRSRDIKKTADKNNDFKETNG